MIIEERMERDAVRWRKDDVAAPFDVALDRAVAPSHRSRTAWFAVAAAIALIATVAAILARNTSGGGRATSGGGLDRPFSDSAGANTDRNLQRYHQSNIGFDEVIRHPGDPETISVMITRDSSAECSVANPAVHSISWSASAVTIIVSGDMLLPKHSGTGYFGFSCAAPGDTPLTVHLKQPLGSRQVHDGLRTAAHAMLDPSELPLPGYLPTGYVAGGVQPIDPAVGRLIGERDYLNGRERILVTVGSVAQSPADQADAVSHLTINGHRGFVTTTDGTCVTWTIRASVEESVCGVGNPDTNLPLDEIVKVARSVR